MREFANSTTEAWLRDRASELAFAMALGLAFALIGPFTTDQADFLPKLGYWVGLIACWFILAACAERGLVLLRAYRRATPGLRRVLLACATALPMLVVTAPASSALNGFEASPFELSEMYGQIALVGWGVLLLTDATLRSSSPSAPPAPRAEEDLAAVSTGTPPPVMAEVETASATSAPDESAPDQDARSCRLVRRLPDRVRGPLVCLRMEDHYVRVHTTQGSALILMRMSDAMADAAPTPGAQAHRSWWISADAIEGFERRGRVGLLRLTNGMTAPVSQRYLASIGDLVDAGRRRLDRS